MNMNNTRKERKEDIILRFKQPSQAASADSHQVRDLLKEVGALCDTLQIHFFLQQTLHPPVRHLVWLHQNLYLNIYAQ